MERTIEYIFPKEYEGKKVYEFLRDRGFSRQNITDLKFTDSGLFIDGNRVKMDYRIVPGTKLSVCIKENKNSPKIPPVKLPLDVVYEDEDVLVVNKPAGMPAHPSLNNYDNTLGNAAAYYFAQKGQDFVYRCINRLDRDTTGLVIIAKNMISANMLSSQHKDGIIKKEYLAIVEGETIERRGTIDAPIGRLEGSSIMRQIDYENGDKAVTHYEVLGNGNGLSLVRLTLDTGRTHQIRVHMKSIGHPLIGDFLYNPNSTRMKRQALHVDRLRFLQPITHDEITLTANVPSDMQEIIDESFGNDINYHKF